MRKTATPESSSMNSACYEQPAKNDIASELAMEVMKLSTKRSIAL